MDSEELTASYGSLGYARDDMGQAVIGPGKDWAARQGLGCQARTGLPGKDWAERLGVYVTVGIQLGSKFTRIAVSNE